MERPGPGRACRLGRRPMRARWLPVIALLAGACDESALSRGRLAADAGADADAGVTGDAGATGDAGVAAETAPPPAPHPSASAGPPWRAEPCLGPVVSCMSSAFRRCYNVGLREHPEMQGTVRVHAKIGADGDVLETRAERVKGLSPDVVACVEKRVSLAHFAPREDGGASIVIPVTFVNDAAPIDAGTTATDGGSR